MSNHVSCCYSMMGEETKDFLVKIESYKADFDPERLKKETAFTFAKELRILADHIIAAYQETSVPLQGSVDHYRNNVQDYNHKEDSIEVISNESSLVQRIDKIKEAVWDGDGVGDELDRLNLKPPNGEDLIDEDNVMDAVQAEEDSDEDEVSVSGFSPEPILEAKDPYSLRQLPIMIGKLAFMTEDDIGLNEYQSEPEDDQEGGGLYDSEDDEDEQTVEGTVEGSDYSSDYSGEGTPQPSSKRKQDNGFGSDNDESDSDGGLFEDDTNKKKKKTKGLMEDGSSTEEDESTEESSSGTDIEDKKPKPPPPIVDDSDDLFGDDPLGGATDELFTSTAKKPTISDQPPPLVTEEPPVTKEPPPVVSAKPLSKPDSTKSGGLFSDDDDDASLRSHKTIESTEPVKPEKKKPAGAVSMFGGVDPFGAINKKKQTHDDEDPLFSKQPPPSVVQTKTGIPNVEPVAIVEPVKTIKPFSSVSKLQSKLGINPLALAPGTAPPIATPTEKPISFDEPIKVKTLSTLTKNRAKGASRRPPSRRPGGTSSSSSSSITTPTITTPTTVTPQDDDLFGDLPPSLPRTKMATTSVPPIKQIPDLFGNDDLFNNQK